MNYYIDTEFLEGTQKTWWGGKTKPTIDLISIGIVAENNKEYYAISKEFNLKEAWNRYDLNCGSGDQRNLPPQKIYWIRENVLKPIYYEWVGKDINFHELNHFTYKNFKKLIEKYGKTNEQIAEEVGLFCGQYQDTGALSDNNPKFYGYYADYDWVVFCWLFGKMNNLPAGFPMYCSDLKQKLDRIEKEYNSKGSELIFNTKELLNYPKQTNEHNALADARWNKELHKFLNEL